MRRLWRYVSCRVFATVWRSWIDDGDSVEHVYSWNRARLVTRTGSKRVHTMELLASWRAGWRPWKSNSSDDGETATTGEIDASVSREYAAGRDAQRTACDPQSGRDNYAAVAVPARGPFSGDRREGAGKRYT